VQSGSKCGTLSSTKIENLSFYDNALTTFMAISKLDVQPCTSEIFDSLVLKFVCTGFCIFSISRPVVQEDKRWTASEDMSLKQQAEALLLNLYQILISLNSSTYLQGKINALKNSFVIHRCT
jgi:hypothetical protein